MSLLSPDVRIALTPALAAAANSRLHREAAVAEGGDVLDALGELLRSLQLRGRTRVVLSHDLSRVWLLPAPPVRLRAAEMSGWVREQLAHRFGDAAGSWRIVWQPAPPGRPLLAGAVESAWIDALQQTLLDNGLKPAAVEPWFAAAAARLHAQLAKEASWLALAEPGRITLARAERGEFKSLSTSRIAGDPAGALREMVARESLLAGVEDGVPVWLESAGMQADWRGASGLEVRQASDVQGGLAAML